MPAPQLTVADVLSTKNRDEVAGLIRATVDRAGGWKSLNDQEWIAAFVANVLHAPSDHALPLTLADARSLTPTLLARKVEGFTPFALAEHLVSAHFNTDVRNTAAVLRHRLASLPDDAWRGSNGEPNALLTTQQMFPAKRAAEVRAVSRQRTDSRKLPWRDRSDGSTYSRTFD